MVRQELVARQLAEQLPGPPARVLDLGCGQGDQLARLAALGYDCTGVDPSERLLSLAARPGVRLVRGRIEDVPSLSLGTYDVVLCHGVLMYLPDPAPEVAVIAGLLAPGGTAALLVRNGDALAMRPGLLHDWPLALRAFETASYENRIGVAARADRLLPLTALLRSSGLARTAWYGVRVFTDLAPSDAPPPADVAAAMDAEERAGRTDPYRAVAALLHVFARAA